ncbi:B-cell lymphoma/leukemia 11B-like [Limulus polyphemus]|uniref:B-cell lymphoma/leukemia 11B-like n=1 Tax=Limulus polyphemus TaxID=6850 RepID=A0ABM1BNZ4_LIMPO|nr:B-cell lymphoma/leukemia 11B-like [Limulus polyphemus]
MSRRKQERPQPRKLITADTEIIQDTLTCGVCHKEFALSDILEFIEHKVRTCNKENCLYEEEKYDSGEVNEDGKQLNINDESKDGRSKSVSPCGMKALRRKRRHSMDDFCPQSSSKKRRENEDAREPSVYVCSTCKQPFATAWVLLQHVQHMHDINIYLETNNIKEKNLDCDKSTLFSLKQVAPPPPVSVSLSEQSLISGGHKSSNHPSLELLRIPLGERQFNTSLNNKYLPRQTSQGSKLGILGNTYQRLHSNSTLSLVSLDSHNSLDKTLFDHSRGASIGRGLDRQNDFYSNRLRQLAGATSPTNICRGKLSSLFSQTLTSNQSVTFYPKQAVSPTLSQKESNKSESIKLKSCEFCGKNFRFQSNLIVHRRSHTGEKPYKCHICDHACSQASKLKRHMKTHRNGGTESTENTSVGSGRSTPDEKEEASQNNHEPIKVENNEEEDEDEDLEEDDEELEEEEEFEETGAENISTETPKTALETFTEIETTDKGEQSNPSRKRQSLLGEVLEKIGLGHIQQYNEAYKQALEESSAQKSVLMSETTSESGSNRLAYSISNKCINQTPLDFGNSLLSALEISVGPNKNNKLGLDDGQDEKNSLYAGLWLPSPQTCTNQGVSSTKDQRSASKSALMVTTSSRLGNSPSPLSRTSTPSTTTTPKPKEQRRNDTCEFCGKIFKNCSNLTVHRRSHTGEKPYKCELCSYACAQSSKLTRHMKTHGRFGKDVYRCRLCNMPFSVVSTLEKHMRKCVLNQNSLSTDKDGDSVESNEDKQLSQATILSTRDSDSRETC